MREKSFVNGIAIKNETMIMERIQEHVWREKIRKKRWR